MFPTPGMKKVGERPFSNHYNLFWNRNQGGFSMETDVVLHVEEGESGLTREITFLCPLLPSPLPFTYHPVTALLPLVLLSLGYIRLKVENWWPLNWWQVLESRTPPQTFFCWTTGAESPDPKRNLDRLFPVCLGLSECQNQESHIPPNPSTVSKLGWWVTLVWLYFCMITVTS